MRTASRPHWRSAARRAEDFLNVLPAILVRHLEIVQFLLQARDLGPDSVRVGLKPLLDVGLRRQDEPFGRGKCCLLALGSTVARRQRLSRPGHGPRYACMHVADSHLADPFVYLHALGQAFDLLHRQLHHPLLPLLAANLAPDDPKLLLRQGCLLLDFHQQLCKLLRHYFSPPPPNALF